MRFTGSKLLVAAAALIAAPCAAAQTVAMNPTPVIRGGAGLMPVGDSSRWITEADYPAEARAARESGEVAFVVTVDDAGLVSDCRVTRSSGSKLLDKTTCRLMRQRARFVAARDQDNEPTSASWAGSVTWSLWQEVPPLPSAEKT